MNYRLPLDGENVLLRLEQNPRPPTWTHRGRLPGPSIPISRFGALPRTGWVTARSGPTLIRGALPSLHRRTHVGMKKEALRGTGMKGGIDPADGPMMMFCCRGVWARLGFHDPSRRCGADRCAEAAGMSLFLRGCWERPLASVRPAFPVRPALSARSLPCSDINLYRHCTFHPFYTGTPRGRALHASVATLVFGKSTRLSQNFLFG